MNDRNHIRAPQIVITAVLLILLYLSSLFNYLLFHTVAEMFSVCIAVTVFLITWNSYRFIQNNYLIVVGIAYLFIGIIDFFHTISYTGMMIFSDYSYYANQLWIAARYFESIVLLIAIFHINKKVRINIYKVSAVYAVVTALILLSVYEWKIFPICYVEGVGLTPFKKISEYIICLIIAISIILLNKRKDAFSTNVFRLLMLSLFFTIITELCFTIYISNFSFMNLVGHYFKIGAFYLIYRAIIHIGVQEPYELIFREMILTEKQLSDQNNVLANQAYIDSLTNLYNHRYIYKVLEDEATKYQLKSLPFVVMIIDIDKFKMVNDTLGHIAGDKILQSVADLLRKNTRRTDIVGRYGGDEFVIILSETRLSDGAVTAEKIRHEIENQSFENNAVTVSIGIKEFRGGSISAFLEETDAKLYAAKKNGRNQIIA